MTVAIFSCVKYESNKVSYTYCICAIKSNVLLIIACYKHVDSLTNFNFQCEENLAKQVNIKIILSIQIIVN